MRRYLALALPLLVLVFAAPARAQTNPQPYSVGGDLAARDAVAEGYVVLSTGLKRRYGYAAVTARCYVKNFLGVKLFQANVRWHWSWWKDTMTMKNWWHETVYPSDVHYGWGYDQSWPGSTTPAYPKSGDWVAPAIISQFSQLLFGSYQLRTWPHLNAGGSSFPSCSKA